MTFPSQTKTEEIKIQSVGSLQHFTNRNTTWQACTVPLIPLIVRAHGVRASWPVEPPFDLLWQSFFSTEYF